MQNLKPLRLFVFFFAMACERIFIKTHSIESGCVIYNYKTGKYTLFEAHPYIFQPKNFTGWGSEGVNLEILQAFLSHFLVWKNKLFC